MFSFNLCSPLYMQTNYARVVAVISLSRAMFVVSPWRRCTAAWSSFASLHRATPPTTSRKVGWGIPAVFYDAWREDYMACLLCGWIRRTLYQIVDQIDFPIINTADVRLNTSCKNTWVVWTSRWCPQSVITFATRNYKKRRCVFYVLDVYQQSLFTGCETWTDANTHVCLWSRETACRRLKCRSNLNRRTTIYRTVNCC